MADLDRSELEVGCAEEAVVDEDAMGWRDLVAAVNRDLGAVAASGISDQQPAKAREGAENGVHCASLCRHAFNVQVGLVRGDNVGPGARLVIVQTLILCLSRTEADHTTDVREVMRTK